MIKAMDICMNCTVKGDIDACLKTPCSQHNSWFAKTIIAEAEKQEPVAYRYWNEHNKCFFFCDSPEPVDGSIYEPLYTHPQPRKPVKFPTMLRKMWSGGEVQAWLDENVNKE